MNEEPPSETELARERGHIEGFLAEWLTVKITDESMFWVGGDDFAALYAEEARVLGYDDDDPVILLRRKSDGIIFEVEIWPAVRRAGTQTR
jgi:hypothetical protein